MLEEMSAFFEKRVLQYEDHMRSEIAFAAQFYPETAALLPLYPGVELLDLGCGTGLELDEIFARCPGARATGIDLCPAMLEQLRRKRYAGQLTLVEGSYFDVPLGENCFDGAVSVESLHHFTPERKAALYRRLWTALRPAGVYVETDYAATDDAEEAFYFAEYDRLTHGAKAGEFHYDVPLTTEHTMTLLRNAGFAEVRLHAKYENTAVIVAKKAEL